MFVKHTAGIRFLTGSIVALGIGGCATPGDPPSMGNAFALTSSAFKDGTMLATKNAGNTKTNPNCIGENVSPPFAWSNVPAGTKSFALVMVDPEGRGGLGVMHWIAYGIPASTTGFAEGETSQLSDKYVGGKGTAGMGHYLGPCTPPGTGLHHYTFTLIATDLEPGALPAGLTRDELLAKLNGHTKGSAGLVGLFGRAKAD
jgi:Raf kinase inhibitor-like YbhB/YbcL family protein